MRPWSSGSASDRVTIYYPVNQGSNPGANFMSKKLGVKISPGGISPNFVKYFPPAFLLEDKFLLDLGKIYS